MTQVVQDVPNPAPASSGSRFALRGDVKRKYRIVEGRHQGDDGVFYGQGCVDENGKKRDVIETDLDLVAMLNTPRSKKVELLSADSPQSTPLRDEFDGMDVEALQKFAAEEGMEFDSKWSKAQLTAAIRAYIPPRVAAPELPKKQNRK